MLLLAIMLVFTGIVSICVAVTSETLFSIIALLICGFLLLTFGICTLVLSTERFTDYMRNKKDEQSEQT